MTDRDSTFREPPHDFDAERALLGSMMINPAAIPAVRAILREGPAEFWGDAHRKLWTVITSIVDAGKPWDGVVVKDELVRRGEFGSIGGYTFLSSILDFERDKSPHHAAEYAAIVHEKHILRSVIFRAGKIVDDAYGRTDGRPSPTAAEVVGRFSDTAARLADLSMSRGASSGVIAEALDRVVAEMIEPTRESQGVQTGYFGLDNLIGGLKPAKLMIVAARPSCGKTTLARNIADFMAVERGVPVIFVSIEMQADEVLQQFVESRAGISASSNWPDREERFSSAREQLKAAPLRLVDDVTDLDDIINLSRVVSREFPPDVPPVLVVDFLQLIRVRGRWENENVKLENVMVRLKNEAAKELGLRVVVPTQLNRDAPRADRTPRLHDLRGSGAIEQAADIVAFIHQADESRPQSEGDELVKDGILPGEVDIIVAKNRRGPKGSLKLVFNGTCVRFENPYRVDSFEENQFSYRVGK